MILLAALGAFLTLFPPFPAGSNLDAKELAVLEQQCKDTESDCLLVMVDGKENVAIRHLMEHTSGIEARADTGMHSMAKD